MNTFLVEKISRLSLIKPSKRFLLFLGLIVTFNYAYTYFIDFFFNVPDIVENGLENMSFPFKLILLILIAPLFETLVFQFAIIEIVKKISKNSIIAILMSALVFASTHFYDFYYVVSALIVGLLLAIFYLTYKNRTFAFFSVFFVHSINNLIVFIDNTFF